MDDIVISGISKYITQPLGGYDIAKFEYIEGVTPLSTFREVVAGVITYLSLVFGLKFFFAQRSALDGRLIKVLLFLHNGALSAVSMVLLLGLGYNILSKYMQNGFFHVICSYDMWPDNRLVAFYYMNYLIKYYELIDTIFLVVRKRPLSFLHVYHHTATMVLCWTQLQGQASVQWVPISLNLFVHVVMYYYYALAVLNIHPWWKKYLTTLQIIQFVLDIAACYGASFARFDYHYKTLGGMYSSTDCCGTDFAAIFGCGILTSYLGLFIKFYIDTYKTRPQRRGKAGEGATKAHIRAE